jgi:hypothetical protein
MDIKKIAIIGGVAAVALWLISKAKNASELAKSLTFGIKDISYSFTTFSDFKLMFLGTVTNPTDMKATLQKIFATVTIGDQQIGTINLDKNIDISKGTTEIPFDLSVNNLSFVIFFIKNYDQLRGKRIIIDGYVMANEIQIPINFDLDLFSFF